MKKDNLKEIVIIGGGIAGLAAAYELKASGSPVLIIEGWLVKTIVSDNFRTDIEPHRFLPSNYPIIEKVDGFSTVNLHRVKRLSPFF